MTPLASCLKGVLRERAAIPTSITWPCRSQSDRPLITPHANTVTRCRSSSIPLSSCQALSLDSPRLTHQAYPEIRKCLFLTCRCSHSSPFHHQRPPAHRAQMKVLALLQAAELLWLGDLRCNSTNGFRGRPRDWPMTIITYFIDSRRVLLNSCQTVDDGASMAFWCLVLFSSTSTRCIFPR